MTVAELLDTLKGYPPDHEVRIWQGGSLTAGFEIYPTRQKTIDIDPYFSD